MNKEMGFPRRRRLCMSISINYIIKTAIEKPADLFGLVKREDGNFLTPIQLYNFAIEAKEKGYKVLPMCGNINEEGYCQGHEINEDGTDK